MAPTIAMLNDLAAAWGSSIARASWQGSLAIAAAWALVRCRPHLSPRVACWVWRPVDLKLVVALLWFAPVLLALLPAQREVEPPPETSIAPRWAPGHSTEQARSPTSPHKALVARCFLRPTRAVVLLLLWVCGIAAAAMFLIRDALGVARLRRAVPLIDSPELRTAAASLAGALGLRSVPEVRAGPVILRPMVVGVLRPTIMLPLVHARMFPSKCETAPASCSSSATLAAIRSRATSST